MSNTRDESKFVKTISHLPRGAQPHTLTHKHDTVSVAELLSSQTGDMIYLHTPSAEALYAAIPRAHLVHITQTTAKDAKALHLPPCDIFLAPLLTSYANGGLSPDTGRGKISLSIDALKWLTPAQTTGIIAHELGHVLQDVEAVKNGGTVATHSLSTLTDPAAFETRSKNEYGADAIAKKLKRNPELASALGVLSSHLLDGLDQKNPKAYAALQAAPHYAMHELSRNTQYPSPYLRIARLNGQEEAELAKIAAEKPLYEAYIMKQQQGQVANAALSQQALGTQMHRDATWVERPPVLPPVVATSPKGKTH